MNPVVTLTDQFDPDGESAGVIRMTDSDGGVMDFPYDDSAERIDQLLNARHDAKQMGQIVDLTDNYIAEPQ